MKIDYYCNYYVFLKIYEYRREVVNNKFLFIKYCYIKDKKKMFVVWVKYRFRVVYEF